ncbi:MAG TPA: hypothetical protein VMG10_10905 [Gemmataceae bacterium]|nr:hypothetical protein [Gemmataceae bacterium]
MARKSNKAAEQALLAALAIGATVENAARKAGISERTAYRRLADPDFQARVDQLRRENLARTAGMLSGAALGSVKTLVDLAQDVSVPASVRRGAARDVLDMAVKYRESAEMEQRVAAIEKRLSQAR